MVRRRSTGLPMQDACLWKKPGNAMGRLPADGRAWRNAGREVRAVARRNAYPASQRSPSCSAPCQAFHVPQPSIV
jgi:hypothetical protein